MKRAYVVLAWIALWIPLSLLFPHHAHLPIPTALMPVLFPVFLVSEAAGGLAAVKFAYVPAACFWVVLVAALAFVARRNRARADIRSSREGSER